MNAYEHVGYYVISDVGPIGVPVCAIPIGVPARLIAMLFFRLAEMLKILTINDFMSVDDARHLISRLVEKYDHDRDGKFSYAGTSAARHVGPIRRMIIFACRPK